MKLFITIGILLSTLTGWAITYEPFGIIMDEKTYWYLYDVCKSTPLFLCMLWPLAGKLNSRWWHIVCVLIIYFGLNWVGDVMGVNEKGNWFTYLTGAVFIYLIALTFMPKWAYSYLSLKFRRPSR
jgi:hypothetical protein